MLGRVASGNFSVEHVELTLKHGMSQQCGANTQYLDRSLRSSGYFQSDVFTSRDIMDRGGVNCYTTGSAARR